MNVRSTGATDMIRTFLFQEARPRPLSAIVAHVEAQGGRGKTVPSLVRDLLKRKDVEQVRSMTPIGYRLTAQGRSKVQKQAPGRDQRAQDEQKAPPPTSDTERVQIDLDALLGNVARLMAIVERLGALVKQHDDTFRTLVQAFGGQDQADLERRVRTLEGERDVALNLAEAAEAEAERAKAEAAEARAALDQVRAALGTK